MPKEFDPTDTTVEEVHELIGDTAVRIANDLISGNERLPAKWRGPALRNGSPYNQGRLVLEITEEYQGATEKTKRVYRQAAQRAIQTAIVQNQEIFVGMIFGEARAGRNYFERWQQTPARLFD